MFLMLSVVLSILAFLIIFLTQLNVKSAPVGPYLSSSLKSDLNCQYLIFLSFPMLQLPGATVLPLSVGRAHTQSAHH